MGGEVEGMEEVVAVVVFEDLVEEVGMELVGVKILFPHVELPNSSELSLLPQSKSLLHTYWELTHLFG